MFGGGVRGGEEWKLDLFILKEWHGRSRLSAWGLKVGDPGTVGVSVTKDRFGPCDVEYLELRRW